MGLLSAFKRKPSQGQTRSAPTGLQQPGQYYGQSQAPGQYAANQYAAGQHAVGSYGTGHYPPGGMGDNFSRAGGQTHIPLLNLPVTHDNLQQPQYVLSRAPAHFDDHGSPSCDGFPSQYDHCDAPAAPYVTHSAPPVAYCGEPAMEHVASSSESSARPQRRGASTTVVSFAPPAVPSRSPRDSETGYDYSHRSRSIVRGTGTRSAVSAANAASKIRSVPGVPQSAIGPSPSAISSHRSGTTVLPAPGGAFPIARVAPPRNPPRTDVVRALNADGRWPSQPAAPSTVPDSRRTTETIAFGRAAWDAVVRGEIAVANEDVARAVDATILEERDAAARLRASYAARAAGPLRADMQPHSRAPYTRASPIPIAKLPDWELAAASADRERWQAHVAKPHRSRGDDQTTVLGRRDLLHESDKGIGLRVAAATHDDAIYGQLVDTRLTKREQAAPLLRARLYEKPGRSSRPGLVEDFFWWSGNAPVDFGGYVGPNAALTAGDIVMEEQGVSLWDDEGKSAVSAGGSRSHHHHRHRRSTHSRSVKDGGSSIHQSRAATRQGDLVPTLP